MIGVKNGLRVQNIQILNLKNNLKGSSKVTRSLAETPGPILGPPLVTIAPSYGDKNIYLNFILREYIGLYIFVSINTINGLCEGMFDTHIYRHDI